MRVQAFEGGKVSVDGDPHGVMSELLSTLLANERLLDDLLKGSERTLRFSPTLEVDRVETRGDRQFRVTRKGHSVTVGADELEQLFDAAYEYRRMARNAEFPLGVTLDGGRYTITERLRGGPDHGMYRGRERDIGFPVLITLGPPQKRSPEAIREELGFVGAQVSVMRFTGPLDVATEAGYAALVEDEPACSPAHVVLRAPVPLRDAVHVARQLARLCERMSGHDVKLTGLRPELVYLADDLRVTQVAPRAEPFLATVQRRSYGVVRCFEHSYLAPELISQKEADGDPGVFSICAMLAHWVTGEHPFVGEGDMQLMSIAAGRRRPYTGPKELEPILDAGLRGPDDRMSVEDLIDALDALV